MFHQFSNFPYCWCLDLWGACRWTGIASLGCYHFVAVGKFFSGRQMFMFSFWGVQLNYLVLSFSLESPISGVEVGGGTCKRDSYEQVSGALRCLCVYVWDQWKMYLGVSPPALYIHVWCRGTLAMFKPRSRIASLSVETKFVGGNWGSLRSEHVGAHEPSMCQALRVVYRFDFVFRSYISLFFKKNYFPCCPIKSKSKLI